jgi:hypothetical protein
VAVASLAGWLVAGGVSDSGAAQAASSPNETSNNPINQNRFFIDGPHFSAKKPPTTS